PARGAQPTVVLSPRRAKKKPPRRAASRFVSLCRSRHAGGVWRRITPYPISPSPSKARLIGSGTLVGGGPLLAWKPAVPDQLKVAGEPPPCDDSRKIACCAATPGPETCTTPSSSRKLLFCCITATF